MFLKIVEVKRDLSERAYLPTVIGVGILLNGSTAKYVATIRRSDFDRILV